MEFSLKELCERAGVTRRMVQGYEEAGLLIPSHKEGHGYLRYGEKELKRVQELRQYQNYGMTLKDIASFEKMGLSDKIGFLCNCFVTLEQRKANIQRAIDEISTTIIEFKKTLDCT